MENKWNKHGEEMKKGMPGRVNTKKQDGVNKLKISESPTCICGTCRESTEIMIEEGKEGGGEVEQNKTR